MENEKRNPLERYQIQTAMIGTATYSAAIVLKHLLYQYEETEKQAARDKKLSRTLRKEASRRASLLEYLSGEIFNIVDMIVDANADDGVADLEATWELEDLHFDRENKDDAEND